METDRDKNSSFSWFYDSESDSSAWCCKTGLRSCSKRITPCSTTCTCLPLTIYWDHLLLALIWSGSSLICTWSGSSSVWKTIPRFQLHQNRLLFRTESAHVFVSIRLGKDLDLVLRPNSSLSGSAPDPGPESNLDGFISVRLLVFFKIWKHSCCQSSQSLSTSIDPLKVYYNILTKLYTNYNV